jgi:hypothetical protein
MDATIAYVPTSGDDVFVPGPNIELGVGDSKVWSDITVADLDGNSVLKEYVLAGTLSVSVAPETYDATVALQGAMNSGALETYEYANLPTGYEGRVAFCSNGRKTGEGALAGTGVPCYFSDSSWRVFYDDSAVAI